MSLLAKPPLIPSFFQNEFYTEVFVVVDPCHNGFNDLVNYSGGV